MTETDQSKWEASKATELKQRAGTWGAFQSSTQADSLIIQKDASLYQSIFSYRIPAKEMPAFQNTAALRHHPPDFNACPG